MEYSFKKMITEFKNLRDDISGYGKLILLENLEDEEGRLSFKNFRESDEVSIQISLTTDGMIELDNQWIKHQEDGLPSFLEGYRPYFFEFYAIISIKKVKQLQECVGQWKKIVLSDSDENEDGIPGEVIFSASPLKRTQKYLVFTDLSQKVYTTDTLKKEVQNIISSRDNQLSESVCTELMERINQFDNMDITIYNVGQGNFIELCFYVNMQKIVILFDIGVTPFINPQGNRFIRGNIEIFKKLQPTAIILSHWDTDHILGITDMNPDLAFGENVLWIVPNPTKISGKVSRSAYILLSVLLKSKAKVAIIHENPQNAKKPICNTKDQTVFLWKGLGNKGVKEKLKFTDANNIGLILQIVKNGKALLFPGDCEYSRMPKPCIRSYNFMVASHHGAAQEFPAGLMASGFGRCIVSFGSNTFGHPKIQCLLKLRRLGYVYIGFTDYVKQFSFCFPSKKELAEIVSIQQAIHELENGKSLTCCLCLDNFGMDALKILRSDIFI